MRKWSDDAKCAGLDWWHRRKVTLTSDLQYSGSQPAAPRRTCPLWTVTSAGHLSGRCCVRRQWNSCITVGSCPGSCCNDQGWRYQLLGCACSWWTLQPRTSASHSNIQRKLNSFPGNHWQSESRNMRLDPNPWQHQLFSVDIPSIPRSPCFWLSEDGSNLVTISRQWSGVTLVICNRDEMTTVWPFWSFKEFSKWEKATEHGAVMVLHQFLFRSTKADSPQPLLPDGAATSRGVSEQEQPSPSAPSSLLS